MRGQLHCPVAFQSAGGLKQPISPVIGDRTALLLTAAFQLTPTFAHPCLPALLTARGWPEINLPLLRSVERFIGDGAALALLDAALGVRERLATALRGAQLLGQLIAAPVAVKLVLAAVDLISLPEDPRRRADGSRGSDPCSRWP